MMLLLTLSITHNFTISKWEYRVAGEVAEKTGQCLQSQAGNTLFGRFTCPARKLRWPSRELYLQG